jgi:hypothetical protein
MTPSPIKADDFVIGPFIINKSETTFEQDSESK